MNSAYQVLSNLKNKSLKSKFSPLVAKSFVRFSNNKLLFLAFLFFNYIVIQLSFSSIFKFKKLIAQKSIFPHSLRKALFVSRTTSYFFSLFFLCLAFGSTQKTARKSNACCPRRENCYLFFFYFNYGFKARVSRALYLIISINHKKIQNFSEN